VKITLFNADLRIIAALFTAVVEKGRNRLVRVNFILIVQNEGIKIFLFSGADCSGTF